MTRRNSATTLVLVVSALLFLILEAGAVNTYDREHENEYVPQSRFKTDPYAFSKSVVHLTTDTFASKLADYPLALVLFHAPWSQSCQDL